MFLLISLVNKKSDFQEEQYSAGEFTTGEFDEEEFPAREFSGHHCRKLVFREACSK